MEEERGTVLAAILRTEKTKGGVGSSNSDADILAWRASDKRVQCSIKRLMGKF